MKCSILKTCSFWKWREYAATLSSSVVRSELLSNVSEEIIS